MGIATGLAIAGAGAAIGGAYLANEEAKRGRRAQERAARAASAALAAVGIPEVEAQEIVLQNPQLVAEFIPEAERALELEDSLMQDVGADQQVVDQQMQTLEGIGEIAEGGLTEADRAAAREIQRDVSQSDAARRKAILQQMAQRGVLGSGMELAAQLDQAQDTAEQQAAASDRLIQQAQARSLDALSRSGTLAGQIRGQDFSEQERIAKAQDAINQWNIANRQDIASRNVQARNDAEAANIATRQQLENSRAALANQQEIANKQLLQQRFNNELAVATGQANQLNNIGNIQNQAAQDQARMISGIGSAIGNLAFAGAGSMGGSKPTQGSQVSTQVQPMPSFGGYQVPARNYNFDPNKSNV